MNEIKKEDRILKKLADKLNVDYFSDMKNDQIALKLIKALLEINEHQFDLNEWNEAYNFFTRKNEVFNNITEARYRLMTYLSKERWSLNNCNTLNSKNHSDNIN